MKGLQLHHWGLGRVMLVQFCTWRSGTCFGNSTDLIFVEVVF